MKFCSQCAASVELRIPEGDNRPRFVCDQCGTIHYSNPNIVAGCIAEHEDAIILCKRAIEPRRGLWTLPAGFMENNETVEEGAIRETLEEANAHVDQLQLYAMYSIPHISQVYMMFRARLLNTDFGPGTESLAVELFREHEIPWEEIAFPVIRETLQRYFEHQKTGAFELLSGTILPSAKTGTNRS